MTIASEQLLIFDLDGTLVDSRFDVATAINHGLQAVGFDKLPLEDIFPYIGKPLDNIYLDILKTDDMAEAKRASAAYREFFFDNCANKSKLYDGVFETLEKLSKTFNLAVATTKQSFMAIRVAEVLGIAPFLKSVQGTDDFPAKPDPEIINILLKRFSCEPENAIMVGDTITDIMAGQAAGVKTCAVSYGIGLVNDLNEVKPDFMVNSFREIEGVVKSF